MTSPDEESNQSERIAQSDGSSSNKKRRIFESLERLTAVSMKRSRIESTPVASLMLHKKEWRVAEKQAVKEHRKSRHEARRMGKYTKKYAAAAQMATLAAAAAMEL